MNSPERTCAGARTEIKHKMFIFKQYKNITFLNIKSEIKYFFTGRRSNSSYPILNVALEWCYTSPWDLKFRVYSFQHVCENSNSCIRWNQQLLSGHVEHEQLPCIVLLNDYVKILCNWRIFFYYCRNVEEWRFVKIGKIRKREFYFAYK